MATVLLDRPTCTCSTLVRSFDVERINFIANHPSVRPTCGGDPNIPLNFSTAIASDKNHFLLWKDGCFVYYWMAPDTYEVHVSVLPEGRGKQAYRFARESMVYMAGLGAERIFARINPKMAHVKHLALMNGFKACGSDTIDLGCGPVTYDLFQWRAKCRQQ